jgi:hypothetical protein
MGSIRTLQGGKKADARQRELEGTLRRAKNEIVDLFVVHGFKVRGDWIQVDDHHELVFDDARVGTGGIRIFRRNSCGRFYYSRFTGVEDPSRDRAVYEKIDEQVTLFENSLSGEAPQHHFLLNSIFKDLDSFLYSSARWIEEMTVPCPDCGGTGETILDVGLTRAQDYLMVTYSEGSEFTKKLESFWKNTFQLDGD